MAMAPKKPAVKKPAVKRPTVKTPTSPKISMPSKPSRGLTAEDYIYAREVAYQPAGKTRRQGFIKKQAQVDLAYLEKKYPGIGKEYNDDGTVTVNKNKKIKKLDT